MSAGEEHLFNVGLLLGHSFDIEFTRARQLSTSDFVMTVLANGLVVFRVLGLCPLLLLGVFASAEGWDELDAAFIESQRVAEVRNGIVRTAERQMF